MRVNAGRLLIIERRGVTPTRLMLIIGVIEILSEVLKMAA